MKMTRLPLQSECFPYLFLQIVGLVFQSANAALKQETHLCQRLRSCQLANQTSQKGCSQLSLALQALPPEKRSRLSIQAAGPVPFFASRLEAAYFGGFHSFAAGCDLPQHPLGRFSRKCRASDVGLSRAKIRRCRFPHLRTQEWKANPLHGGRFTRLRPTLFVCVCRKQT